MSFLDQDSSMKYITSGIDPDEIRGLLAAPSQNYISKKRLLHEIPLCKISPFTEFTNIKTTFSQKNIMKELYVVQQNIIDNKINLKTLIIENFTQ